MNTTVGIRELTHHLRFLWCMIFVTHCNHYFFAFMCAWTPSPILTIILVSRLWIPLLGSVQYRRSHTMPSEILVTLAWFLLHVAIIYRVELKPRSSHSPCCCRRYNTDVLSIDKLHDAEACSVGLSRSAVRRADSHPAQDPGDLRISGRRNICCKLRWHCNEGGRILSYRVKWSSTGKIEHSWAKVKICTTVHFRA